MKKSGLLKLLDRFEGVLRRCGIDYRTLRLILGIRLIMDSRRVPTVLANNRRSGKTATISGEACFYMHSWACLPG